EVVRGQRVERVEDETDQTADDKSDDREDDRDRGRGKQQERGGGAPRQAKRDARENGDDGGSERAEQARPPVARRRLHDDGTDALHPSRQLRLSHRGEERLEDL